ncbi:MAG TPA: diiron oxygenase [Verrucomicrobiae bacterium]|nr:diiron oxygenase [Verrucomicrobiae bacterium]
MSQPIDFSKRFLPELLTPLRHTPIFNDLSPAQRLRYNQLQAAYFNEQIIFFESAMAQHILRGILKIPLPKHLIVAVNEFIAEEKRHSQMFRELNRRCFTARYGKLDFYFVNVPHWATMLLRKWACHPETFPFFLWILFIQEERALYCAKQFLAEADCLEPSFVTAQRQHLADEVGHVGWDEELLDLIWPTKSERARRINVSLFQWMMGEYFTTPKRSGLRVIHELVQEFSDLKPLWPELRSQMLALANQGDFRFISYSREVTPKSFARFDRCPEFKSLGKVLAGYSPMNVAPPSPASAPVSRG